MSYDFEKGDKVASTLDTGRVKKVKSNPVNHDGKWYMMVYDPYYGHAYLEECRDFVLIDRPQPRFNWANLKISKKVKMKLTKPAIVTLVILLFVTMLGSMFMTNYNDLVRSKADVDNSWAKVETQYQRRFDLIGNVVESVKGSQFQEQKVFKDIADGRKTYASAQTTDQKAAAATQIETSVAMLPKLQEAYPELRSNEQVSKLVAELQGTENTIAGVRNTYNDTANNYNVNVTSFPKNVFANLYGYHTVKLFKADTGAAKAPKVNFSENR